METYDWRKKKEDRRQRKENGQQKTDNKIRKWKTEGIRKKIKEKAEG